MHFTKRNALTIRDEHAAEVDAIIQDAVILHCIDHGLALRANFPRCRVAEALERAAMKQRGNSVTQ